MKQRMSRDHKGRKTFKVNNILSRLRDRCQGNDLDSEKKFLTLTFLGFYDKTCKVKCFIECFIVKLCVISFSVRCE